MKITNLCSALLLFLTATVQAKAPAFVAQVEGAEQFLLDNGLQILLVPDTSSQRILVSVTFFCGAVNEGQGQAGMAHLLEHMVFKGTETRRELVSLVQSRGGMVNGMTSNDTTTYFVALPSSDPENLVFSMDVIADLMQNCRLSEDDLTTERTVVLNELDMGENEPEGVLLARVESAAYLFHPYGREVIGTPSDLKQVTSADLRTFYRHYYQPDNAILVVAGSLDKAETLELVEKHFGGIPKPERIIKRVHTVEAAQDGPRYVEVQRVGDVPFAALAYHVPAGAHPDTAAIRVLSEILTGEPAGRLYQAMVPNGLAASVHSMAWPAVHPGLFVFFAALTKNNPPENALTLMQDIIERTGSNELPTDEVDRAKQSIMARDEQMHREARWFAMQLGRWAAHGDWRLWFHHRDLVGDLTPSELQRVANLYLKPSNRTAGLFRPTAQPDRAEIPPAPDPATLLDNYQGKAAPSMGEHLGSDPDVIEQRITRSQLKSGMKLALLPKATRAESVNIELTLHIGDEKFLADKLAAAQILPHLIIRGSETTPFKQIQQELDRLRTRIRCDSDPFGSPTFSVSTNQENLPAALRLLAELLRSPALLDSEFDIVKNELIANLESTRADPQQLGFIRMEQLLSPWPATDIRHTPNIDQQLADLHAATADQARQVYAKCYGVTAADMTVTGQFNADTLLTLIEEAFGKWKPKRQFERIAVAHLPAAAVEEVIHTPDKPMAVVFAGLNLQLTDTDPDYPALRLATFVLGGDSQSRLNQRIREKEGWSYSTFAYLSADQLDDNAHIIMSSICGPDNARTVLSAMLDELTRLIADGLTPQELEQAKQSYSLHRTNMLGEDRFLLRIIHDGLFTGRTLSYQREQLDSINALTSEQFNETLKRRFAPAQIVKIIAGDINK